MGPERGVSRRGVAPAIGLILVCIETVGLVSSAAEPAGGPIRAVTARATPLFVLRDGRLRRIVEVKVDLAAPTSGLVLRVIVGKETVESQVPQAARAFSRDVEVPDVTEPTVIHVGSFFHMWYVGNDGGTLRIGHATSIDGLTWVRDAANPVLNLGDLGSWDWLNVYGPSVVKVGNVYKLWYSGATLPAAYANPPGSGYGLCWQEVRLAAPGVNEDLWCVVAAYDYSAFPVAAVRGDELATPLVHLGPVHVVLLQ